MEAPTLRPQVGTSARTRDFPNLPLYFDLGSALIVVKNCAPRMTNETIPN